MHQGYVKLWRKVKDSAVWSDPDLFRTWACCLMLANHAPGWFKVDRLAEPVLVGPGQFITGRFSFHKEMFPKTKLTTPCSKTTWRWLETLEKLQNVSIKTSNKFSIVTIINWDTYQMESGANVQENVQLVSSKCPTSVQLVSTNKNDKNEKNNKKERHSCSAAPNGGDSDFEKFWEAYPKKVGKTACLKKWQQMNGSKPPLEKILSVLEAQKKTPGWTKDNGQFIPNPLTWINQGRWDDQPVDPLIPQITRRKPNKWDAI